MISVVPCSFRWGGIDVRVTRATVSQGAQGAKRSDVRVGSMWPRSWRCPAGRFMRRSISVGGRRRACAREEGRCNGGGSTSLARKEGARRPYCGVPPRRRVRFSARGDIHCETGVLGRQISLWDASCIGGCFQPFSVPDAATQGMFRSS
jgi:hypothetical protein